MHNPNQIEITHADDYEAYDALMEARENDACGWDPGENDLEEMGQNESFEDSMAERETESCDDGDGYDDGDDCENTDEEDFYLD